MSSRLWAHPQLLALLHAAKQSPEDDAPRLVLADWLEEHGEGERAEFVRCQLRLAPGPPLSRRPNGTGCVAARTSWWSDLSTTRQPTDTNGEDP